MDKMKEMLGKKTWLGIGIALILSAALDAIGALFMCSGVIAEKPMWVYGAYGIGSFVGVRIAVRDKSGTLLHGLLICVIMCAVVCLGGLAIFRAISFSGNGSGVLLGLACGCLAGGLVGGGRVKKGKGKGHSKRKGSK